MMANPCEISNAVSILPFVYFTLASGSHRYLKFASTALWVCSFFHHAALASGQLSWFWFMADVISHILCVSSLAWTSDVLPAAVQRRLQAVCALAVLGVLGSALCGWRADILLLDCMALAYNAYLGLRYMPHQEEFKTSVFYMGLSTVSMALSEVNSVLAWCWPPGHVFLFLHVLHLWKAAGVL